MCASIHSETGTFSLWSFTKMGTTNYVVHRPSIYVVMPRVHNIRKERYYGLLVTLRNVNCVQSFAVVKGPVNDKINGVC